MREIARAGIGEIVVSWWGRGSARGRAAARGDRGRAQRTRSRSPRTSSRTRGARSRASTADVAYLRTLGVRDFFVYHADRLPAAEWQPLDHALQRRALFAQTPLVGLREDGRLRRASTPTTSLDVSRRATLRADVHGGAQAGPPLRAVGRPRLQRAPRDGRHARVEPRPAARTYDSMWRARDPRAAPTSSTITSYNEWNEGTQIEPARPAQRATRTTTARGARAARPRERAYLNRTRYWVSRFKREHVGRAAGDERG